MLAKKSIGSYRILGRISSGGMGDVYLGEDTCLERQVAIKALKQELVSEPDVIERFKLEAITLARLNHPNVTTIYAFLEEDDNRYLVIELISGWELSIFIEKVGALPLSVALYLHKQALAATSAVHAQGIVHRDLKPSNVMVTEGLIVKVMDFGIARFQMGNRLTRHSKLIGTIEYMSPEQILGKDATTASDIYSLGVLLFEMVTGRAPFSGGSEYEVMKSQVENPPPSPLEFKADIPDKLVDVLSRALAKTPEERYPSAEAFMKELDETGIDTSNATSTLLEIIRAHQLEKEKTIDYSSPLADDGNVKEPMLTGKSGDSKKQAFFYANTIYRRLISALARTPWLGPLILFVSLATVGGLVFKNNPPASSKSPIPEERVDEPIRRDMPVKITAKEALNTNDSSKMSGSVGINSNMSPLTDLNQKSTDDEVLDDRAEQAPSVNVQPSHLDQSPVGMAAVQPLPKVTIPSRQPIPMTKGRFAIEQTSEVEKPQNTTRTKSRPKPTDDDRRGGSEWVIHK